MYKGHETPPYTVERTVGEAEIRAYPPVLVAEVTATGSRSGAASEGFRALAGYIFGGNADAEKMAMTTPVAQSPQAGAAWTVRFMMPADRTLAIAARPGRRGGATCRTAAAPRDRAALLRLALGQRPVPMRPTACAPSRPRRASTLRGEPEFMFYDSPFTLPWNRRNEVAFAVE